MSGDLTEYDDNESLYEDDDIWFKLKRMAWPEGLYKEAAEEIERLRLENNKLKNLIEGNKDYAAAFTPEDIGMEKVSDGEHLSWPWYRYPHEAEFQPVYAVRDVPAPDKSEWKEQ